ATDAAITYLEQVGMDQVEERERALAEYLCRRLQELEYVTVIGSADGAKHVGSVAFDVRGIHPHDVASILDAQGVCIRAGHHCAQPLLSYLGWSSTCRASVGFYNDAADIDRLIEGLQKVWVVFNGRN
ncbi:MAG: aminotransferase class V-fold PLP-dependent enzyme, partial [Eggerthellaceae bacterium]|nr:aminotransferase class V-fold PLP-dependent enzyme [Eggerthellaceae bacterium]